MAPKKKQKETKTIKNGKMSSDQLACPQYCSISNEYECVYVCLGVLLGQP